MSRLSTLISSRGRLLASGALLATAAALLGLAAVFAFGDATPGDSVASDNVAAETVASAAESPSETVPAEYPDATSVESPTASATAAPAASATAQPAAQVAAEATATPTVPASVVEALGIPDPDESSAAESAEPRPPALAPQFDGGAPTRIRIPSIDVDAPMIKLGYASDGTLDIPYDAVSVGWYSITPPPGRPGNSLLGAHVD